MRKKLFCAVLLCLMSCVLLCPVIAAEMEKSEDGQYIIVEARARARIAMLLLKAHGLRLYAWPQVTLLTRRPRSSITSSRRALSPTAAA